MSNTETGDLSSLTEQQRAMIERHAGDCDTPGAGDRFVAALRQVLSVTPEEMAKREAEWQETPHKRGRPKKTAS